MATTYCVRADIESILSTVGLVSAVDDDESGGPGISVAEEAHVTNAIERAAVEMNHSLDRQYVLSDLSGNDWCKWCNASLAALAMATRRGQPAPASLVEEVSQYRKQLEEIRWGRDSVPEANPSYNHLPTVTNFKVQPGKYVAPIRVDTNESTGPAPEGERKRQIAGPGPF